MVGKTNAVISRGGAEAVTGKIPASSNWSLYNFYYYNVNGEFITLSRPSAQSVSDVLKNTVVFINSSAEAGIEEKNITGGGLKLAQNTFAPSEQISTIFPGDFLQGFLVTGDFEIA